MRNKQTHPLLSASFHGSQKFWYKVALWSTWPWILMSFCTLLSGIARASPTREFARPLCVDTSSNRCNHVGQEVHNNERSYARPISSTCGRLTRDIAAICLNFCEIHLFFYLKKQLKVTTKLYRSTSHLAIRPPYACKHCKLFTMFILFCDAKRFDHLFDDTFISH